MSVGTTYIAPNWQEPKTTKVHNVYDTINKRGDATHEYRNRENFTQI